MGAAKYIKQSFREQYKTRGPLYRKRVQEWRKQGSIVELERPTNPVRARHLGYKAKEGYLVVRVKVKKGRRKRPRPSGGRKPAKNLKYVTADISKQTIAEQRAGKKYYDDYYEVVNSYWVGEDGQYKYYEVILAKIYLLPGYPSGRVFRGLTSSAKKSRAKVNNR